MTKSATSKGHQQKWFMGEFWRPFFPNSILYILVHSFLALISYVFRAGWITTGFFVLMSEHVGFWFNFKESSTHLKPCELKCFKTSENINSVKEKHFFIFIAKQLIVHAWIKLMTSALLQQGFCIVSTQTAKLLQHPGPIEWLPLSSVGILTDRLLQVL